MVQFFNIYSGKMKKFPPDANKFTGNRLFFNGFVNTVQSVLTL